MKNHFRIFSPLMASFVTIGILLSGCAGLISTKPTATAILYPTIRPPLPTRTPTTSPTVTALPTATSTITPKPTLLPPIDDFSQARLYSSGSLPGWDFSLTVLLPKPIQGKYTAELGDPVKIFNCRPLIEYDHPERLYCRGRQPGADKQVVFSIIEETTGQVVFKGFVYLPLP